MNGYDATIFEMHDKPGGQCTTWERKGYKIDTCIHWLVGSSMGSGFHRIWEELGAIQGRAIVDFDEYMRIQSRDGKVFIMYTNVNKLMYHMKELAPEDSGVIDEFTGAVRKFAEMDFSIGGEGWLESAIKK